MNALGHWTKSVPNVLQATTLAGAALASKIVPEAPIQLLMVQAVANAMRIAGDV